MNYYDAIDFNTTDEDEINEARKERADEIAELIDGEDFQANSWNGGSCVRVYVKRMLSRGRRQDCGFIEVLKDGSMSDRGLTRARGSITNCLV
jgi:hypothetical protein